MTWHYVISENCNLACTYCGVDVKSKVVQNNERFDLLYSKFAPKEEYNFDYHGGEPLLFCDELQYILNILQKDPLCKNIRITTNGTIFHPKVKVINHPLIKLTISNDGLHQIHNRGKPIKQEFIDYLHSINKSFSMHWTLSGNFFDSPITLLENYNYLTSFNCPISIGLVKDIDSWTNQQVDKFLKQLDEWTSIVINEVNNNTMNFGTLPDLIRSHLNNIFEFTIQGNTRSTCGAGHTINASTSKSDLIPCIRFERIPHLLPTLTKEVIQYGYLCDSCEIRHVCPKGCLYENIKNGGPVIEVCNIYKGIHNIVKRLLKETHPKLIKQYKG